MQQNRWIPWEAVLGLLRGRTRETKVSKAWNLPLALKTAWVRSAARILPKVRRTLHPQFDCTFSTVSDLEQPGADRNGTSLIPSSWRHKGAARGTQALESTGGAKGAKGRKPWNPSRPYLGKHWSWVASGYSWDGGQQCFWLVFRQIYSENLI